MTEIRVPEKAFPQNKEGKECECMNREYLLTYKKGRVHWLVSVGSHVKAGECIAEAEIEKRTFEVPSPADGVLTEQRVAEGERFDCADVIGVIE